MTQHYIRQANRFFISDSKSLDIHDKIPAGNYVVGFDKQRGQFYLEDTEQFTLPKKLYGDTVRHGARIFSTFEKRAKSTGVLLSGEKGSGKTLLAKYLSIHGFEKGVPTIIINQAWYGDAFNQFIQSIDHPAIIIFDEFEKTYKPEEQEAILTLLDGVFPTKKLFILTSNDKWKVNEHMRNRPGRLFYLIEFDGLDVSFVREYCEDNLNNKEHIELVCKVSALFTAFNFDLLQAVVEEANRYDESPIESLKLLNAKPNTDNHTRYTVSVKVGDVVIPTDNLHHSVINGNPTNRTHGIAFNLTDEHIAQLPKKVKVEGAEDDDDDSGYRVVHFSDNHLRGIKAEGGVFTYVIGDTTVTLSREKERVYDYGRYAGF